MEAVSATVDITPMANLATACHGPRNQPTIGVGFPFEANLLGMRDGSKMVIIVSIDWFFASPSLRSRILKECAGQLQEAELIVAASHVHTSPNPDRTKEFGRVDSDYLLWAEDRIADKVKALLRSQNWTHANLRFSKTECNCAIHRRRKVWVPSRSGIRREFDIFPNPDGPSDKEFRMLRVEDSRRNVLALVWGISCHPTDWPTLRELSSDFPGGVRVNLREAMGNDVPVLFLQGFAGTLRPRSVGRWPRVGSWRGRLITLAIILLNGSAFVGFTKREYSRWMAQIVESAKEAFQRTNTSEPIVVELQICRKGIPLSSLGISGKADPLIVHTLRISTDLILVGISAEVSWEYYDLIQAKLSASYVWPVGYIDHAFGYLPTSKMLPEGGYEVSRFMRAFGISGEFQPSVDETVLKTLL